MSKPSLTEEAEALLDRLDERASAAGETAARHRATERYPYRRESMLQRPHLDGSVIKTWAYTRDLSVGGVGCLHAEELAAGTPVLVSLSLPVGGADDVAATAVYCQRLRSDWFLVGLKFEKPVDPRRYVLLP